MTQSEVIKEMEKQPKKWFSAEELSELIGNSRSSVSSNLKRLLKSGYFKTKESKKYFGRTLYLYKLKCTQK